MSNKLSEINQILAGDIQHRFLMSGDIMDQVDKIALYIQENYTPNTKLQQEKDQHFREFAKWYGKKWDLPGKDSKEIGLLMDYEQFKSNKEKTKES